MVATVERLSERIAARFPDAGLYVVCKQLLTTARIAKLRSEQLTRPIYVIRLVVSVLIIAFVIGIRLAFVQHLVEMDGVETDQVRQWDNLLQLLDAGTNVLIVLGAILLFLTTLEARVKRARALKMIHELRSIAHIIDMHQLTKDPERVTSTIVTTNVSPRLTMSRAELGRYLDYCSEMLALTGKLAALYVQNFNDVVALAAVSEVETLTTGLSRKIWQKMMIVHQVIGRVE
ncbi:MAG: hypothetical protein CMJ81_20940 [Planctomycetaceae bacterium]|nr:hypothetical protein [Planctomycetaceae bacterium]MBP62894.1 hypothetical protein [Planctomycetaceae bacterium]